MKQSKQSNTTKAKATSKSDGDAPSTTQEEREVSIDRLVGQRVRALRKRQGWTLHDLASMLEMSYVYLSELERGEKPWKLNRLARAAEIFHLPPALLQEPSIPLERLYVLAEMLDKLSVLPEEQFAAVAQLLESMKP